MSNDRPKRVALGIIPPGKPITRRVNVYPIEGKSIQVSEVLCDLPFIQVKGESKMSGATMKSCWFARSPASLKVNFEGN